MLTGHSWCNRRFLGARRAARCRRPGRASHLFRRPLPLQVEVEASKLTELPAGGPNRVLGAAPCRYLRAEGASGTSAAGAQPGDRSSGAGGVDPGFTERAGPSEAALFANGSRGQGLERVWTREAHERAPSRGGGGNRRVSSQQS